MRFKSIIAVAWLCGSIGTAAAIAPYKDPSLTPDERARDLVARMTLDEKISQMVNGAGEIKRLDIPAYDWWNEALHGVARAGLATVFPQPIGMAATFDDEAVYETFDIVSDEARAKYHEFQRNGERDGYKGLTFWTPNINIFRDPRWGRGQETYGEDPRLTSRMGIAVVKGLQGDGTARYDKAHACAKHFAVHSGPEWNRHSFNAENVSRRDLYETYLPAFKALVTEGDVKEVMCAYNRYKGEPCCSNKELLTHILRHEWDFDGVVVSDCGAIHDFYRDGAHMSHKSGEEAATDAVISGTDLECLNISYKKLKDAVAHGLIDESKIDESVFRLMRARIELGTLDHDSIVEWSRIPYSVVDSQKHKQQALKMARESMTLLTNNGVLPLQKNLRKIAVIGPNAADSVMMWGNYNGTPSKTVTILEGIQQKLPSADVEYLPGCDYVDDKDTDYAAVASSVADAEVIVFVGGISPSLEGEELQVEIPGFMKGDRSVIELPEVQHKMLAALKETGKPVVFVMCTGSALAIPWEAENLDAILNAWYPGQAGGTAVADVLFGDYNPAGRLPVTFYRSTSDLPDFEDYNMEGRTYRYFLGTPLFPFGHGLSYTDFAYGNAKLNKKSVKVGDDVELTIPVQNIGSRDGEEVVQVYVRNRSLPSAPLKSLAAFKRIPLKSGGEQEVTLTVPSSAFESYDAESDEMRVISGTYELLYGGSSDDAKLKNVTVSITHH